MNLVFFLNIFSKILLNSNQESTNTKSNNEINTTEYFNIKVKMIINIIDVKNLE